MAGTLVITTLSDGTNSTSATNCIQGSAKAWAQFTLSGTTPVINGSFNVSSITRTAAGRYYVDFTTPMANANYSVAGSGSADTSFGAFTVFVNSGTASYPYYIAPTTTRFYFSMLIPGSGVADSFYTTFAIFSS
jgi:hypothetical protein